MLFAISAILTAMVSIQSGASLAKQLFPLLGAQGTTTLRIGFAALILCAIWRPWRRKLTPAQIRHLLFYGLALGSMNLQFYLALQKIPLGLTVALEFTGPLSLALFASRRKLDFLWAFLAGLGILLVLPLNVETAALDPWGILFALGAGACWALYIYFGQKISATLHGGFAAAIGMMIAALVVLPFGLVSAGSQLLDFKLWPTALAVAILSSALPYSLEMIGLRALPPQTFGILMSLEPAFAALAGLVFLNEKLSLMQGLAIMCIIVASGGTSLTSGEKKKVLRTDSAS